MGAKIEHGDKKEKVHEEKKTFFQEPHYASSGFAWPDATLRTEKNHCDQPFAFPKALPYEMMNDNGVWWEQ